MIVDVDKHGPFRLDQEFIESYRDRPVPWGFGDLSWATYQRTYRRAGEDWVKTCRRVIEGMFTVQRVHCLERGLPWDERKARSFAENALERLWQFKWTPPGRGLWIRGTRFMYERGGAALNNCGFVSTREVATDYARPYLWMLAMSMLGVGVGFDTRGRGTVTIQKPARSDNRAPSASWPVPPRASIGITLRITSGASAPRTTTRWWRCAARPTIPSSPTPIPITPWSYPSPSMSRG